MNISDSERAAAVLEQLNYKKTLNINEADLILVTMCSIRQSAVDRIHSLVEKIDKLKAERTKTLPTGRQVKAILTGCILKKDKKIFIEGFDYVLDIKDIKRIPELLGVKNKIRNKTDYLDITPKYESNFSANVPIMTGCNNFCSYCVVPYVREREISRPAKSIIQEITALTNPTSPRLRGAREIWLLGQNVNSYKDGQTTFPELLKLINDIPGNFWIRFTSSHPKDFSDELINAMATCKKIKPYLNLPIQSGDDKILKLMKRYYTVESYKNKIKKLKEKIPDIALSTDIIVGFPGETKTQFDNTVKLFREIKYDLGYISKYSSRAGTTAAKLKDNVSVEEKKRREKVLTDVLKQTALEKNKTLIGTTTIVLINESKNDFWLGKDEHYRTIKVYPIKYREAVISGNPKLFNRVNPKNTKNKIKIGQFITAKITAVTPFTLSAEAIE
jgi:tRNA-2-methylthio-N6-dimethylallyladenosine synthase